MIECRTMNRRAVTGALLLLCAGCSIPGSSGTRGAPLLVRPAHVEQPMLTCAQATRAAREAVMFMGYSITAVQPAKAGVPGRVIGTRNAGWTLRNPEEGMLYTVTVTVSCSDAGATFDAVTDEGVNTQLTFAQKFAAAVKEKTSGRKERRPGIPEPPPQGIVITVEPERGGTAQAGFGVNLPGGVMPVRIEITNHSRRRYRFTRDGVDLVTEQGERARPLSLDAASAHLTGSGDTSAITTLLQEKAITDAEIPPGASLSGYLYFNAAAYRRARLILTDLDSDESEGFSVEF